MNDDAIFTYNIGVEALNRQCVAVLNPPVKRKCANREEVAVRSALPHASFYQVTRQSIHCLSTRSVIFHSKTVLNRETKIARIKTEEVYDIIWIIWII